MSVYLCIVELCRLITTKLKYAVGNKDNIIETIYTFSLILIPERYLSTSFKFVRSKLFLFSIYLIL